MLAAPRLEVDTRAFEVTVPGVLWKVGEMAPEEARASRAVVADFAGATEPQLAAMKASLVGMLFGERLPRGLAEGWRGHPHADYVYLQRPELRGGETEFVLGVYQRGSAAHAMRVYYARLADGALVRRGEAPDFALLRDVLALSREIAVFSSAAARRANRLRPY